MFTQENIPLAQDKEGRYIIDRDGSVFRCILNFLRGGNLNLPPGFTEYDQLQEEVDFYQLDDMKELLHLWKVVNLRGANCDLLSRYRSTSSLVKMNVGDKEFYFTRSYLSNTPGLREKLRFMAGQAPVVLRRGQKGFGANIQDGTIDCDPTSFQYILNFLTKRGSYIPKNKEELENLKNAVHHYEIDDMKAVLDQQIFDATHSYTIFQKLL